MSHAQTRVLELESLTQPIVPFEFLAKFLFVVGPLLFYVGPALSQGRRQFHEVVRLFRDDLVEFLIGILHFFQLIGFGGHELFHEGFRSRHGVVNVLFAGGF